ncbi:MAG: hypothetical protein ACT4OK_00190 [Gemmobacter sp.]
MAQVVGPVADIRFRDRSGVIVPHEGGKAVQLLPKVLCRAGPLAIRQVFLFPEAEKGREGKTGGW